MVDGLLILLHAAAAVLIVRTAATRCLPTLERAATDVDDDTVNLLADVLLPVVLALPLAVCMVPSGSDVFVERHFVVAHAVAFVWVACGIALMLHRPDRRVDVSPRQVVVVPLVGVLLVLLALAGTLTIGVGQTAFAATMVLWWWNMPQTHRETTATPEHKGGRSPTWLLLAAMAVQMAVALLVSRSWWPIFAGVALLEAVLVFAMLAAAGRAVDRTMRVGLWGGAYLALLAIGLHSFAAVARATLDAMVVDDGDGVVRLIGGVAGHTSTLAFDGVALAGLPMILAAAAIAAPLWRRMVGVTLLIAGGVYAVM